MPPLPIGVSSNSAHPNSQGDNTIDQPGSSSHSGHAPPGMSENDYNGNFYVSHPPPGLVGQTRVIDENAVSVFSDIVRYFDTGMDANGDHIILNMKCTICHESMLVVPPVVSPWVYPEEVPSFEPMVVLPCGHFFGAQCLAEWIESQDEGPEEEFDEEPNGQPDGQPHEEPGEQQEKHFTREASQKMHFTTRKNPDEKTSAAEETNCRRVSLTRRLERKTNILTGEKREPYE
ncbi:hypothetical protein F4776DRAFT_660263 [Hypoxylon sp. NC0597]|nr:hypothetical protein F4776DRAFT_660263 [Hypoxylon sp. NC0597]